MKDCDAGAEWYTNCGRHPQKDLDYLPCGSTEMEDDDDDDGP